MKSNNLDRKYTGDVLRTMRQELGLTTPQLAQHLASIEGINVTPDLVYKRIQRSSPAKSITISDPTFVETDDGAEIVSESSRIITVEELLKVCKVDMNLWQVETSNISKYDVSRKSTVKELSFNNGKVSGHIDDSGKMHIEQMYSITVKLSRKITQPLEATVDNILERLKSASPKPKSPEPIRDDGEYLLIPSIYDVHFGKLASDGETLQQAYDSFRKTGEALIARSLALPYKISRIMFPIGNDAIHADNLKNTTTKGTWVEISADMRDVIDTACKAFIWLASIPVALQASS